MRGSGYRSTLLRRPPVAKLDKDDVMQIVRDLERIISPIVVERAQLYASEALSRVLGVDDYDLRIRIERAVSDTVTKIIKEKLDIEVNVRLK